MKLVELLARELKEWPEGYSRIVQSSENNNLPIDLEEVYFDGNQWDYRNASLRIYEGAFSTSCEADDYQTAIITREMWQAERDKLAKPSIDPIRANRDRILEIDRLIADMTTERAERVAELAAEGLELCGGVGVDDMRNWWNWRAGDVVECLDNSSGFKRGERYKIKSFDEKFLMIEEDSNGIRTNGWLYKKFKFHSRP